MAVTAAAMLPVMSFAVPERAVAAETTASGDLSPNAASEEAAASGEAVEVSSERTEYATTMANPDGTFTLTQSAVPQRAQQGDGTWGDVDATLVRGADGRLGPKNSVVDLTFSGAGSGDDLIRMGENGRSIELDWPGKLPEPTLDGPTATYADVPVAGVDLQMTATAEGYRQLLVVKTPQAAENPALDEVVLYASGSGLAVLEGVGGGLRAIDEDGNPVFKGPAGQMWDSAGDGVTVGARAAVVEAGSPEDPTEDPTQPGAGDASAPLPVAVEGSAVSVSPDQELLRGSATVYPVYIDPSFGIGVSERTVLSSDGDKFWQFDGDYGVGRCSVSGPYYCGNNYTNRMYFEFSPSTLAGKYVLDATFRAYETWSFSCDPKWVDLERTNNISEGTSWPGPASLDQMGDRYVSNGRGANCSPDQPNAWVEFNDNPNETDENLASTVRSFADGKISRLTLMLRAKDEGDPAAWKRFDDNAELKVTFAYKPGVPSSVGVIPGDGTTGYCKPSSGDPLIVTRPDPMMQARVQTAVEHSAGAEEGWLQAEFLTERYDATAKAWVGTWSDYSPHSGWDPDGTLEKVRMAPRADGLLYRYKARTQSHWSYGGKTGDLFSSFSSWCYFKIDSTAPKAPQITTGTPYTQCTATLCEGRGGPGIAGSFTFKPNTVDTDIIGYRWRLISSPKTQEATGSTAQVQVVPALGGQQVLSVEARDVRQRWGPPTEFHFKVQPAVGPVGRWRFNATSDAAAGATSTVTKDSATEGTRHDATLFTDSSARSTLARGGNADTSLALNDASVDEVRDGYAATASPALNTKDSFTVSTWARMTGGDTTQIVLSAPGVSGNAFALYYSAASKKWIFNRGDKDQANPIYVRSYADAANPPLKVWTHLAGVFKTEGEDGIPDTDPANDTVQLFINGRPQGQPVLLKATASTYEPWVSTGGMQFGRAVKVGVGTEHFRGRVDETTMWQRALTPEEIVDDAKAMDNGVPSNELVAHWDATTSTGTTVKESSSYPVPAMTLSSAGATLDAAENSLVLNGTTGYAAAAGPVVDETGSFTVSARVQLNGTALAAKPVGYAAQVAGQRSGGESSWALWATKPAAGIYQWLFTRTATDATGKVIQSAEIAPVDPESLAVTDTWVQLTGVYDAQEAWQWTDPADPNKSEDRYGKLHLYLGEIDQLSDEKAGFTAAALGGGELAAGRGTKDGGTGNYLPGSLEEIRVWTGAMSADQVRSQVLGTS